MISQKIYLKPYLVLASIHLNSQVFLTLFWVEPQCHCNSQLFNQRFTQISTKEF